MTDKEAIKQLASLIINSQLFHQDEGDIWGKDIEALRIAIKAVEKVQDYEAQWLNDINNPLEPLKLSKALDSEIFKLKYRMENEPEKINMLDYTIIAALQDCLNRYKGVMKNEI